MLVIIKNGFKLRHEVSLTALIYIYMHNRLCWSMIIMFVDCFHPFLLQDHKNFVNAIDYAPDGSKFVSGGADGRVSNLTCII